MGANTKSKHSIQEGIINAISSILQYYKPKMSIKGMRPDSTDTGTLRPDLPPLEKLGTQFEPLKCPQFDHKINLPPTITPSNALGIFTLFFSLPTVQTIVQNTNKNHERVPRPLQKHAQAQDWVDTTVQEIYIYLGILIYISIYKEPEFKRYWNTGPIYLYHLIRDWMSHNRFEALHY